MIRPVRAISAEEENFRAIPIADTTASFIRRDSIEPEPIGTIVALIFRIDGYDADCDGSLMARLSRRDENGNATGWIADAVGLYPDATWVLSRTDELSKLAERSG